VSIKYKYEARQIQKEEIFDNLKYKILPYPKGDNKRYDASYSPDVQGLLF
jgi:hypothetical protein